MDTTPLPRQPYDIRASYLYIHHGGRLHNKLILGSMAGSSFEASRAEDGTARWADRLGSRCSDTAEIQHRLAPSQRPARHPAASWYFLLDVLFQREAEGQPASLSCLLPLLLPSPRLVASLLVLPPLPPPSYPPASHHVARRGRSDAFDPGPVRHGGRGEKSGTSDPGAAAPEDLGRLVGEGSDSR